MSSLVYGIVQNKRAAAPADTSRTTSAPAMGTYLDTLTALVPAEALALYAGVVIPFSTHTASLHGKKATTISNPTLLEWSVVGLLALSSLLYLVGRRRANFGPWDLVRVLIPPMAFTAWMLVQTPGVWDIWWHASTIGERSVIAAFAAIVLAIIANALGIQADQMAGVPAVAGVSPASGSLAGGDAVTVTGSGFTGATGVSFGTVPAPDLRLPVSDTQLTVISPPATAAGQADVTVATAAGTSAITPADQFTYAVAGAAPTVANISPPGGSLAGGDAVTVTGTGFTGRSKVSFGTADGLNPDVVSDSQLTVTSPPGTAAGPVDVRVTTPVGISATTSNGHYTYKAPPIVEVVEPNNGPLAGGDAVTVTGTGFTGTSKVSFGTADGLNPDVVSDSQLTVTSPPGTAAGPVAVTVTTPIGTSATSSNDHYTYKAPPSSPPPPDRVGAQADGQEPDPEPAAD